MIELYDDDGESIRLPTRREVCRRCNGDGTIVNPAIDGNGISTDDECWQDDDFREGYLGGRYDITCPECQGRNVVDVVDEELLLADDPALHERWVRAEIEEASSREAEAMERRYCDGW